MEKEYYKEYYRLETDHWVFSARRKIALSMLGRRYLARCAQGASRPDILDAGTGTGVMLGELGRFGNATGLDISKDAVEFCRKRGLTSVVKGSVGSLPFHDSSFDIICAMDILEHLDDDGKALEEFHRALRPEGILLVTVPAHMFMWGPHDEINMHKRRYTLGEVSVKVRRAGFKIERISYFNFFFFPAAALIRVGRRIIFGDNLKPKSDLGAVPGPVNKVLEKIFSSERFLLKCCNLPFGVSVICVARRE